MPSQHSFRIIGFAIIVSITGMALAFYSGMLHGQASSTASVKPDGKVTFAIDGVSAKKGRTGAVLFECTLSITNATDGPLKVKSEHSQLSSLFLYVVNEEGWIVAKESTVAHLSHVAPGTIITLREGETTFSLVIDVREVPQDLKSCRVLVVGTLPGDGYGEFVSSNVVPVEIR